MRVLLLILSLLPMQDLLQEAKQHYMNYQNDSCAIKTAIVREYCLRHQGEGGVALLSADVENVLGALAQVEGKRDSAAIHYRNAYEYTMDTPERGKASMYCLNLADNLRQTGDAPEAAQWLRRALVLNDSLAVHDLDCAINTQLGQIYSDLRYTSMSDSYFDAAQNACEPESFDDYFLANARGNACFFNEDYENAITFFRKAGKIAEGMDNEFRVKIPELNIGECYLSLHQLDSAVRYIDAAYEFWSASEYCDESIMSAIRGMKAGAALERGDFREAEKWLSSEKTGQTSPIYENAFNKHMMEISILKSDWKNAYHYCHKILDYSDSLSRSTLESNFAESEMRFARDTTLLHQKIRIADQQARISRMGIVILIITLALVGSIIVIRKIQEKRREEKRITDDIINRLKIENVRASENNRKVSVEEPSGDRLVPICDMVLFTYQQETRKWLVLLKDGTEALMSRSSHAADILELSPCFTKLNPASIVNMDYIKSIGLKDSVCILKEPFSHIKLNYSRSAGKNIKSIIHAR